MIGIDIMVGAGEGLSTQVVVLRVRSIDVPKLRAKLELSKTKGAGLAAVLALADQAPKQALDLALPMVKKQMLEYGITAEVSATDAPPPPRAPAETLAAFFLGIALPIVGYGAYRLFKSRSQ